MESVIVTPEWQDGMLRQGWTFGPEYSETALTDPKLEGAKLIVAPPPVPIPPVVVGDEK